MTADEMARLHAAAFTQDRPWSTQEFVDLLASPHVRNFSRPHGFLLLRTVLGEAEILTLAVDPIARRQGIATSLLNDWRARTTAINAFLEVAADNAPALALYERHGFAVIATRPAYYARRNRPAVDGVVMTVDLTAAPSAVSTA